MEFLTFPINKNDFYTSLHLLFHVRVFEMLVNDLLLCYVRKELKSNRTKANHATSQRCGWESIMIAQSNKNRKYHHPHVYFFSQTDNLLFQNLWMDTARV